MVIYDYEAYKYIGPFRVVEHNRGKAIDKSAWSGKFPAQAKLEYAGERVIKSVQEVHMTLGNDKIQRRESNTPRPYVDGKTAERLRVMFGFPTPSAAPAPRVGDSTPEPVDERRYKTVQGFLVRSKAERDIANLLDRLKIQCHYERWIPNGGGYLCDFYLPQHDIYIEYWGLPGDARYEHSRKVKTRIYNNNGLRLLELEPADEKHLEERLRQELRRFGINADGPRSRRSTGSWLARLIRMIQRWLSK